MKGIRALKRKQKLLYKSIVSVECPILKETIYFTSEGFNHLIYDSNRKPRNINEQFLKLSCLAHVPKAIEQCQTILSVRKLKKKIRGKYKKVAHYGLIGKIKRDLTIRVIVEKVGRGKCKFLSVMPHDKKTRIEIKNKKHR